MIVVFVYCIWLYFSLCQTVGRVCVTLNTWPGFQFGDVWETWHLVSYVNCGLFSRVQILNNHEVLVFDYLILLLPLKTYT